MAKGLSAAKAKKILKDGYVKGKPLTAKQIKYFGAIANGATPLKAINGGWLDKYQNGGDVPKAQRGKILKKVYDLYNIYKSTNKVVDAANTVKKTDKVVSNSLNPLEIADQIIPRFNVLGPVGGDIMQLSPLNAIPFYGKNLKGKNMAFRKFGNSIYDVIQRQALSPVGGSDFRMGKNQIVSEGNWAAMSRPSENYSGVFEATFDFNNPFANLRPTGIRQRNGVLITDKLGNRLTEIPLTEPGLSFNRRLPFSTRYVPIDKQKLIDDKFQLATFGPRLQSLAEKYGIGLLGAHLIGEEDTYNKYTIDPIIENTEKVFNDLKKMKSDDDNKDKLKGGGWLDKFGMGGSLPGASGMMYSRNSTTTPEEPKKAQNGKAIDWSKQRKKYPGFMDNLKDEIEYDPEFVDFDSVRRAVRNVESLDGKLMWNPESTATGLYGQRFSEIKNDYPGTRKDFVKDTVAQNEFFKRRFYDGLEASETTPLLQDANDLYNDYSPQIKNFPYSKEDIAVLSNFIGRGGTRKYLGYAIRDGKPLAEALPNVYGPSAKQSNKTPEEYLELARQYYKTNELKNGGRCWPGYKTVSGKTPFSKGSCQKAQDGTSMISQYEEPAWYEKLLDYAASPMTTLGYLAKGQDLPDRIPINVPGRSEFDNWTFDTINPAAYIKYGASALRNLDKGEYFDAAFDAVSAIPILPALLKKGKKPVKGIDLEKTPFINAFTKPTRSVSGPLPKELEPYLSRRVYPFNKEQEVFESFLSTDRQLKNIDSKSINYDPDGNIIPNMEYGGEIDKAQRGALLKLAKKYGSEAVDYLKGFESEAKRTIRNFIEKDLGVKDKLVKKVDVPGTNVQIQGPTTLARALDNIGLQHATGRSSYLPSWAQRADDKRLIAVAQSPNMVTKHAELLYEPRGKYYTFPEVFIDNPLTAGRTFKALEDFVPKGGILKQDPQGTLSTDSFKLMLNRLKSGKFSDVTNYNDPNVSRYLNTFGNKYKVNVEDYGNLYDPINDGPTSYKFTQQQTQDILNDLQQAMFNLQKQGKVGEGFTGFGIRSLDRGFNEIGIPNLSIRKNYQEGGVIEDDRGQWAYPGEITKINSNNITMKGVNYPVLGISDTGDKKMMQPGKDYKFDGNSVTEYPMAKDGKSLVELNQLTNFTNYNTPQPGGWLNKYN